MQKKKNYLKTCKNGTKLTSMLWNDEENERKKTNFKKIKIKIAKIDAKNWVNHAKCIGEKNRKMQKKMRNTFFPLLWGKVDTSSKPGGAHQTRRRRWLRHQLVARRTRTQLVGMRQEGKKRALVVEGKNRGEEGRTSHQPNTPETPTKGFCQDRKGDDEISKILGFLKSKEHGKCQSVPNLHMA